MEWAEVDLNSALWTIPAAKAKSDRAHDVQLAPQVIEILRSLPKSGPFVFAGKTGRGITGYAQRQKAARRRDAEGVRRRQNPGIHLARSAAHRGFAHGETGRRATRRRSNSQS